MTTGTPADELDLRILDALRRDIPLVPRPWEAVAALLDIPEAELLERLERMSREGIVRGISPIIESRPLGITAATLVALPVVEEHIREVADIISHYTEVSHNFQRDHHYSLWFTLSAKNEETLHEVLHMSQDIFGVVDFRRNISDPESVASRMSSYLRRDTGTRASVSILSDPHYVLGMKRIPAKAETQGQEIFSNPALHAVALIHGEINNYSSLVAETPGEFDGCRGDLDLVLRLYRLHGQTFGRKLNGLFSLAVLDERERCLILLNDRFGMAHQVYWTLEGDGFYFATHLRMLLACPEVRKEIDPEGLNLFLKYSYIPSPWTVFRGVKKLPPGHLLDFQDGKVTEKEYWVFDLGRPRVKDLGEAHFGLSFVSVPFRKNQ